MQALVVIDRLSYRFDRPFTYSIPERFAERVTVGSLVRVPLQSRRVRGWVVATGPEEEPDALPLVSVSGPAPLFDETLLAAMREIARRFLAPLPSMLRLLTPPQLGKGVTLEGGTGASPLPPGSGSRELWRLGHGQDPVARYTDLVEESFASGRGAIVMVPEVSEGSLVLDRLRARFASDAAVVHSAQSPAERSQALWSVAAGRKRLVLGGRAAVFSPAFAIGMIIVHSEQDRSYKEQRTPYYDAREVALVRADFSGARLLFSSSAPSLSTMSRLDEKWVTSEPERESERRSWPAVELIDPPRTGMNRRAIAAIIEARNRGERTLIVVPRTASGPSGPGPQRLAEFIKRVVPRATVSRADREALGAPGSLGRALANDVVVATEAALAEIERPEISTAIAVDADVLLHRPVGRAAEEGFQTLWALGTLVAGRRPRGRLLIETESPEHYTVQALTRGDYNYFAGRELSARKQNRSPPFVRLVVLRSKHLDHDLLLRLQGLDGVEILGPAPGPRGLELLLKVNDLETVLDPLREIVSGAPGILVEVDPRDW